MNKATITILLLLTCLIVNAQDFSTRLWHEGRMVTFEKDTLRGQLKYNVEANTLQIQVSRNIVKSFSSNKVLFFEFYDKSVNNYRQFYSLPYRVSQDFKTPIFFEVLYEGALTLLVREKIVIRTNPNVRLQTRGLYSPIEQLVYTYYFVDKKGNMKEYRSGKKVDFYPIFIKNNDMVRKFVKKNHLRVDRLRDIVRVVAFYNSI